MKCLVYRTFSQNENWLITWTFFKERISGKVVNEERAHVWWRHCTAGSPRSEIVNSQEQLGNLSWIRRRRHGWFLIKLRVDGLIEQRSPVWRSTDKWKARRVKGAPLYYNTRISQFLAPCGPLFLMRQTALLQLYPKRWGSRMMVDRDAPASRGRT